MQQELGRLQAGYVANNYLSYAPDNKSFHCASQAAPCRAGAGRPGDALHAAEAALEVLTRDEGGVSARQVRIKAHHRRAQALASMGRVVDAVRAYKAGVGECGPAAELHAALRLMCDRLPPAWLARYWAQRIEMAHAPHRLSPRDGVLLRPVPMERRLSAAEMQEALEAALAPAGEQKEARELACAAWAQGATLVILTCGLLHEEVLGRFRWAVVIGVQLC